MALFYKLSIETIDTILTVGLPKSAQNLLWYLCKLNPFGDHRVQITWQKAQQAIGISKTSFYRALAQLKDAGLLISQSFSGFCVSPKNGTPDPKMGLQTQNWNTESQNWDSTLYIDLQTDQTLSEGENAKKEKISDPDAGQQDHVLIAVCGKAKVEQHSSVSPISQGEKNFSAAARTKKQTKGFNWLPEGPWNIEGKLDPNFRDWLAKDWQALYGGTIHQKRADVLSHFKKDPANLAIRWEQYRSEFLDRVQNTQILLSQGVQVKPETQDKLLTNQRALTAELPAEINPVAPMPEARFAPAEAPKPIAKIANEVTAVAALLALEEVTEPSRRAEAQELEASAPAHEENQESTEQSRSEVTERFPLSGAEGSRSEVTEQSRSEAQTPSNIPTPLTIKKSEEVKTEDGKRLKVFQRQEVTEQGRSEDDRDPGKLRAMVNVFLNGFGGGKSRTPSNSSTPLTVKKSQTQTQLEKLNSWLHDPILRDNTIAFVNRSESFKYCPLTEEIIHCEEF